MANTVRFAIQSGATYAIICSFKRAENFAPLSVTTSRSSVQHGLPARGGALGLFQLGLNTDERYSLGITVKYVFAESKSVLPEELSALFVDVGWGQHTAEQLERSINAYPFVVHARRDAGALVGYVSAFSDGVFSTMLGELIVHPKHQRQGIAAELLARVEAKFPNAPVYIKALGEAKHFFVARGYKVPKTELTTMFKKPSATVFAS